MERLKRKKKKKKKRNNNSKIKGKKERKLSVLTLVVCSADVTHEDINVLVVHGSDRDRGDKTKKKKKALNT